MKHTGTGHRLPVAIAIIVLPGSFPDTAAAIQGAASDDPGVERTDLTAQYVTAAEMSPELTYQDFKEFAGNSPEYSYIPGDDLSNAPDSYTGGTGPDSSPSSECESFLAGSEEARLQYRIEEEFAAFEDEMRLLSTSTLSPVPATAVGGS